MAVKIGEKAPAFKLFSSDKEAVALSAYHGKNVVLLFFPLAFTGVCTAELCAIRDDISTYNNLNSEVIALSVDSPYTLAKFKAEQNLNFPLLSDFNKEVSRAYDAYHEDFALGMKGVSKRSAFVIDKEGVVQYAEVLESPRDLPNFAEVQKTLSRIN